MFSCVTSEDAKGAVQTSFLSVSATAATTYFLWRYFFPRQARGEFDAILDLRQHERIVVVAPHSDDEALASGGLIHQAVKAGKRVDVILITNGDGFALATGRAYRRLRASPQRFIEFGQIRQKESLQACAQLGVPENRVYALGYPDRGIRAMWYDHWEEGNPYQSPFTRVTAVPYPAALRFGAPYAGESLVKDLMALFRRLRPTLVVGPHLNDAHIDHWSTHNFVRYALALLEEAGEMSPLYLGYLVHRGNWPAPKGLHRSKPLVPPASMLRGDWRWLWYGLEPDTIERKHEAILLYRTQIAILRRYMISFVRVNEIFSPHSVSVVPNIGRIPEPTAWPYSRGRVLNPEKDTVVRRLQGAANITGLDAVEAEGRLLVRIDLRTAVSREVLYRLYVRAVRPPGWTDEGVAWLMCSARVRGKGTMHSRVESVPQDVAGQGEISAHYAGNAVVFAIPKTMLYPRSAFMMAAETRLRGLLADVTGWQVFRWSDG